MGVFTIAAVSRVLPAEAVWTVLADGDNCLLFVERRYSSGLVAGFADAMSAVSSHEMVVEKPTSVLERVTFGQSQVVRTTVGLKMVRNVFKTLSGAFCGYRHYDMPGLAPRLVKAIAQAELSLSSGVPVLQPYFEAVVGVLSGVADLKDPDLFLEGHLLHAGSSRGAPIDSGARRSFELAFGIGVEGQIALEGRLVGLVRNHLLDCVSGRYLRDRVVVQHGVSGFREPGDLDFLWHDARV